jgi:hypothetical protein
MQQCKTLDALVTLHGPPRLKIQHQGFEVWHYPLGVEEGVLYSIHVSVNADRSMQAFLYFEPVKNPEASPLRRWWEFWKWQKKSLRHSPGRQP